MCQQHAEQPAVDGQAAVVTDEAELLELVHEEIHPRAGGSNHLRQRFLSDSRHDALHFAFLAEVSQQQEDPGQTPFAGVEELIDEIASLPSFDVTESLTLPRRR